MFNFAKTGVRAPSGKKRYDVYKSDEEKNEAKMMAAEDFPRIARKARIAAKKKQT